MIPPPARTRLLTATAVVLFLAAGLCLARVVYLGYDMLNPPKGVGYRPPGVADGVAICVLLAAIGVGTVITGYQCLRGRRSAEVLVWLCGGCSAVTLCGCGFSEMVTGGARLSGDFDTDVDPSSAFHTWVYAVDLVVTLVTGLLWLTAMTLWLTQQYRSGKAMARGLGTG